MARFGRVLFLFVLLGCTVSFASAGLKYAAIFTGEDNAGDEIDQGETEWYYHALGMQGWLHRHGFNTDIHTFRNEESWNISTITDWLNKRRESIISADTSGSAEEEAPVHELYLHFTAHGYRPGFGEIAPSINGSGIRFTELYRMINVYLLRDAYIEGRPYRPRIILTITIESCFSGAALGSAFGHWENSQYVDEQITKLVSKLQGLHIMTSTSHETSCLGCFDWYEHDCFTQAMLQAVEENAERGVLAGMDTAYRKALTEHECSAPAGTCMSPLRLSRGDIPTFFRDQ